MKKYKFKYFLKFGIFLFGVSFFIFACQTDDETYIQESNTPKTNLNLTILRTKDVEKNTSLMRIINRAEKKVSDNKAGRIVYNADYDFTINTSYAKVIETNGLKNYTFGVYRTQDNGLLENLLLEEQADSTFKVSLVQYNITSTEKNNLIDKQVVDVEDKITFVELDDISDSIFYKVNSDAESCTVFSYEWEQGSSCASGQHEYTDAGACDYWGNANQMATSGGWVLTASEGDCGGGGSTPGPSGPPAGNPSSGNQSGGYGSGGGAYVPPSTTPVLCPECPELDEECAMPPVSLINTLNSVLGNGNFEIDCNLTDDEMINLSSNELEGFMDNLVSGNFTTQSTDSDVESEIREDTLILPISSFPETDLICSIRADVPSPNNDLECLNIISATSILDGNTTFMEWTQINHLDPNEPNGIIVTTNEAYDELRIKFRGLLKVGLRIDGYPVRSNKLVQVVIEYGYSSSTLIENHSHWYYIN